MDIKINVCETENAFLLKYMQFKCLLCSEKRERLFLAMSSQSTAIFVWNFGKNSRVGTNSETREMPSGRRELNQQSHRGRESQD